jgi:hypothetical protein
MRGIGAPALLPQVFAPLARVHEIASSSLVTRASPQPLTLYLLVRAIQIGAWVAQKVF